MELQWILFLALVAVGLLLIPVEGFSNVSQRMRSVTPRAEFIPSLGEELLVIAE